MNVLLISANTLKAPYPVYPIGLDHVAASLHGRHRVCIEDLNLLTDGAHLADRIRAFRPDLIGLSLRNIDNTDSSDPVGFMGGYRSAMAVIRRHSRAPVVLGGSGFTLFPRRVLDELGADYGIVGEGERLDRLLDALEAGHPPEGLPGVILPGQEEMAPPPPWTGIPRAFPDPPPSHRRWYLKHGAMLNLQTKRGCPFRCIYCTYPAIEGHRLRRVDPMAAAHTAMTLERAGARYLYITDSSFNADIDHSLAVATAFRQVGLSIPWGAFFTPLKLPPGYFDTLVAAGLRHVEFGTDALCDPVLRAYGKPFTTRQVMASHAAAREAGCHVAHYLLLGGPGETAQTLEETLSRIDLLRQTVLFFFCGMRVYPHTRLHRQCQAAGDLDPTTDLLEPRFFNSPGIHGEAIHQRVAETAAGRRNWVIGAGGEVTAATLQRMYDKGFCGPLWEYLAA